MTETYGQLVMILSTMFSQTFGNVVSFGALGTLVDCISCISPGSSKVCPTNTARTVIFDHSNTGWSVIFGLSTDNTVSTGFQLDVLIIAQLKIS